MIQVLICDDHRIVREGLKLVLSDDPDIRICGEAATGEQALTQVRTLMQAQALDVVLLDVAMPERDGLDVLQCLRRDHPRLPVLMLSTYPEAQYAVRCIQLGASGYLNKSADPDHMVAAVRKLAAGERYLTDSMAQALAGALMRTKTMRSVPATPAEGIEALSHREHQVFRLLTAGHSVGEIGAQLGLAANTVSTYRARILEKTGARNDVELALLTRPEAAA